jgi:hypothetical protein
LHDLLLRNKIDSVIIRGHGTRTGDGSSLGDPKSKFWMDRLNEGIHSSNNAGDWHICALRLARELRCWKLRWFPRYCKSKVGVIIIDRSILSRAMFCKAVGEDVSQGNLYPNNVYDITTESTLPDICFFIEVPEVELLKRLNSDPKSSKHFFREKLIKSTTSLYSSVITELPLSIKERIRVIQNDGTKSALDVHEMVKRHPILHQIFLYSKE